MRDIKFRGQRVDTKEWVYGLLVYLNVIRVFTTHKYWNEFTNSESEYQTTEDIKVIPETVGQYTGLPDKNGNEIYEGDVMDYGSGRIFYITYVGCQFVATFNERVINTIIPIHNFEIIGNIHQNPELLQS